MAQMTLAEVKKQMAELKKIEERLLKDERSKVIAAIKAQMSDYGIKIGDLRTPRKKEAE